MPRKKKKHVKTKHVATKHSKKKYGSTRNLKNTA